MSANPAALCCPGCGAALAAQPGGPLACLCCGPLPPIAAAPALALAPPRRSLLRSSIPVWAVAVGFGVLALIAVLIGGVWWSMHAQAEANAVVWANQLSAARMDTARAHMSQNRWDDAVRTLQEALAIDRITCREEIAAELARAESGQADALLLSAREATLHREPDRARRLLLAYRRHPRCSDGAAALALEEEIDHALSDAEARRWLRQLSEAALAQLSGPDAPIEKVDLKEAGARLLFLDTARKHLPAELRRRQGLHQAALQEEANRQAQRRRQEARLRNTAEFRRLAAFVADSRKQYRQQQQLAQQQERALQLLYRQLKITAADEQQRLRRELIVEGGLQRSLEDALAVRRGQAKQECRRSGAYSAADINVFDELVDREVDALLREMAS